MTAHAQVDSRLDVAPVGQVALAATAIPGLEELPPTSRAAILEVVLRAGKAAAEEWGAWASPDGLYAFTDPGSAVRWARDVLDRLERERWPAAASRLRPLALDAGHTPLRSPPITIALDQDTPIRVDDRLVGSGVERVRGLAGAGRGRALLMTAELNRALRERDPRVVAGALDRGVHRLARVEGEVGIAELLLDPHAAPCELESLPASSTNLPDAVPWCIGRDQELTTLSRELDEGARLVSILGPGGMGKTRLVQRLAALRLHEYALEGGVWFCDLTSVRSKEGLLYALARTLKVPLTVESMRASVQIGAAIAGRGRILIVLDNFEPVTSYAESTLAVWLERAPRARFLVTSRERLHLDPEVPYLLQPLDPEAGASLFLARAREKTPDFADGASETDTITKLVSRIEGIPLAIELAAAWAPMLTARGILDHLTDNLTFLSTEQREGAGNRRTLHSVTERSWRLLEPWERLALAQCAVFDGGFTLDAVDQVVDVTRFHQAPAKAALLGALRDKSLLRASHDEWGHTRWSMYASVQEFALEQLSRSGRRAGAEDRHAWWYLHHGEQWVAATTRRGAAEAYRRLSVEVGNLLAVHERTRIASVAIRTALVLDVVLAQQGPFDRHVAVLDQACEVGAKVAPDLRGRALIARARAYVLRGRLPEAEQDLIRAGELLAVVSDRGLHGQLAHTRSLVLHRRGEDRTAMHWADSATADFEAAGDRRSMGVVASDKGLYAFSSGEMEDADGLYRDALATVRAVGDVRTEGVVLARIGNVKRALGDPSEAEHCYHQALEIHRSLTDRPNEALVLGYLGGLHLDRDELEQAEDHYTRALAIHREVGDDQHTGIAVGNLGRLRHLQGQHQVAQEHYSEATFLLEAVADQRFGAIFKGIRASLYHEVGDLALAARLYQASLQSLEDLGDRRFLGLLRGRLGALCADLHDIEEAEHHFAEAEEMIGAKHDAVGRAVLAVHRAHLLLASARGKVRSDRKGALELWHQARAATRVATEADGGSDSPLSARSADVRIALRLLDSAFVRTKKS